MIFNAASPPKLGLNIFKQQARRSSILRAIESSPVLISSNKDIYTNLALENWIYNKIDFSALKRPIVMIWTDEPSVVIGRHQNPWTEAKLGFVNKAGIKLARRYSGGGCVYHDDNNINISIIGDRKLFDNRQDNLKFLAQTLKTNYDVNCEPSKRHDLIHCESGFKISGSAAKLGRFNSYHHFTLLVDTNRDALYTAIRQNQQEFLKTNSTSSVRSKVINLKELKSDLDTNQVICDLANAYNKLYSVSKATGRAQTENNIAGDGEDSQALESYKKELESWDWLFGKTPKFKLDKKIKVVECGIEKEATLSVQINKGMFESIEIDCDMTDMNHIRDKFQYLIGTKFTYHDSMVNVAKMLDVGEGDSSSEKDTSSGQAGALFGMEKLFSVYLLQLIHDSNY